MPYKYGIQELMPSGWISVRLLPNLRSWVSLHPALGKRSNGSNITWGGKLFLKNNYISLGLHLGPHHVPHPVPNQVLPHGLYLGPFSDPSTSTLIPANTFTKGPSGGTSWGRVCYQWGYPVKFQEKKVLTVSLRA